MEGILVAAAARMEDASISDSLPTAFKAAASEPCILGQARDLGLVALWKPPNWTVSLPDEDELENVQQGSNDQDTGRPLPLWVKEHLGCSYQVCRDPSHQYGLLHRLDRNTSGAVLCATSYKGLYLSKLQFATRQVVKIYWALCHGHMVLGPKMLEAPLCGSRQADGSFRTSVESHGRTARTEILQVLHLLGPCDEPVSLVEVKLHTGRQHQIRATSPLSVIHLWETQHTEVMKCHGARGAFCIRPSSP